MTVPLRRRPRSSIVRAFAIVAAGSVTGVACSSADSSSSASTSSASATSAPTTAPASTTSAASTPTSTAEATGTTDATSGTPVTTPPVTEQAATTSPTTDPPGTTADTEPARTTATTAPDLTEAELADMELARTALITLDDFPDGWTEDPDDPDDESPDTATFEAEFDECLGRDDDRVGDDLEDLVVSTGDFHPIDQNAPSVSHEVVLAPDEATAVAAMTEVVIDGAEPCLADVIQRFYVATFADDPDLAGIAVGEVVVTRTETERPDDVAVGVSMEIPLTLDGQDIDQFLEILYLRQGRALSELSFSSFGEPFSRDGYTILSDDVVIALAAIG